MIIMENTDPPEPVAARTIDSVFTNNPGHGRAGFFPAQADPQGLRTVMLNLRDSALTR